MQIFYKVFFGCYLGFSSRIIAHNGLILGVAGAFQHKTSYEAESSNLAKMFIRRMSAPLC